MITLKKELKKKKKKVLNVAGILHCGMAAKRYVTPLIFFLLSILIIMDKTMK